MTWLACQGRLMSTELSVTIFLDEGHSAEFSTALVQWVTRGTNGC
jgi:hypothetical protein